MGWFDKVLGNTGIGDVLSGIGSIAGLFGSDDSAEKNYQAQKEFAQNGIAWKVQDAKNAGIHPLYALGSNTATFSPSFQATQTSGEKLGSALSSMGQSMSRAAMAKQQAEDRALDNEYKNAQIAEANARADYTKILAFKAMQNVSSPKDTPAMPQVNVASDGSIGYRPSGALIGGQGDSVPLNQVIKVTPSERVANYPTKRGVDASSVNDLGFDSLPDGGYANVVSKDLADRMDGDWLYSILWSLRTYSNLLMNDKSLMPPYEWLPPGYDTWEYRFVNRNGIKFAWYPARTADVKYHAPTRQIRLDKMSRDWYRRGRYGH